MPSIQRRLADHIDRRAGIETARTHNRSELGYGPTECGAYEPSRWLALPAALPRNTVGPDDVFLDIGSGKGRVVLQAARRYPFRRVIGIEVSAELNAIARANLATSRPRLRCQDVQLITGSATAMTVPDDVTIAYLYNPFRGTVFDLAVDRLVDLVERRGRGLRIVYLNAVEHDRLARRTGVTECPGPHAWRLRAAGLPAEGARNYELWPSSLQSSLLPRVD